MKIELIPPILSGLAALYVGSIALRRLCGDYKYISHWKRKSYLAQTLGLGAYAFFFIAGSIYYLNGDPVPPSITNWSSYAGVLMIAGIYCGLRSEFKKSLP